MIKLLRGKKRKYPGKSRSNIFVWRAIFGVMILVGSSVLVAAQTGIKKNVQTRDEKVIPINNSLNNPICFKTIRSFKYLSHAILFLIANLYLFQLV